MRRGIAALATAATASITIAVPATAHADGSVTLLDREYFCNSSGACGNIELYLNHDNGQFHARLISTNGSIKGSVAKLETSGYEDFRNVPYAWSRTVGDTTYGDGSTYVNTDDVVYSYPGRRWWWWRGCGYIGSASRCTSGFST